MSLAHILSFRASQRVPRNDQGMISLGSCLCPQVIVTDAAGEIQAGSSGLRGRDRTLCGCSKEAANFGLAIMGVKEASTMVLSKLCSFFAKPSMYFSVSWACFL